MRILFFTDTHGSEKAFKQIKEKSEIVDLLVCCGDITIFGNDQLRILKKYAKLGKELIIIHGNHESITNLKKDCEKFGNIHFLHGKTYEKNGLIIFAWGGGGFSMVDKEFDKKAKEWKDKLEDKKYKKRILITHAPPYDTKIDKIMEESCGSKSIYNFIKKNKIDYAFAGHLHENFDKEDKIGNCIVMNPGPYGVIIEIGVE